MSRLGCCSAWRAALVLIVSTRGAAGALLLDFKPTHLGQNSTHQPTNYSVWRWSTTGGHNATMVLSNGSRGTQVDFGVGYCEYNASGGPGGHNPYPPTHDVFGCYRSELSLQRAIQDMVIDWQPGVGSSVRWFGLALLLPKSYAWDSLAPNNGPSFQIHDGNGEGYKGLHPILELTAVQDRWTLTTSHGHGEDPNRDTFDLGPTRPGLWEDWVIRTQFSPLAKGLLQIWRNGVNVLPTVLVANAYNDTRHPYIKFGVYKAAWKVHQDYRVRRAALSYAAFRVGDEHATYAEVSTAPPGLRL